MQQLLLPTSLAALLTIGLTAQQPGELGFQEIETSKYLTGILEKNGFTVQRGIAGIPTSWIATGDRASR